MNWAPFYPAHFPADGSASVAKVEALDVGCGYGGLLCAWPQFDCHFVFFYIDLFQVELATTYPERLALGLEIRVKVSSYVRDRIVALRKFVCSISQSSL